MCWKPKINIPNPVIAAPSTAPLQDTAQGALFGDKAAGDTTKSSDKGVASVTVKKDSQNTDNSSVSTNFGTAVSASSPFTSKTIAKKFTGMF